MTRTTHFSKPHSTLSLRQGFVKKTDPNILLAQRKIEERLGLNTRIVNKKNNSGKVILKYSNLDQFELLSKLLTKG